jgi:hypothetical protein
VEYSRAGATQDSLQKDFRKHGRLQINSGETRLIMLLRHTLRELEKLLKSFLDHIPVFLFSRTTDSSNVAMVCFRVEAREGLPWKSLNGLPRFTGATIFHHLKEKA